MWHNTEHMFLRVDDTIVGIGFVADGGICKEFDKLEEFDAFRDALLLHDFGGMKDGWKGRGMPRPFAGE